jgi:hypothetical protein
MRSARRSQCAGVIEDESSENGDRTEILAIERI